MPQPNLEADHADFIARYLVVRHKLEYLLYLGLQSVGCRVARPLDFSFHLQFHSDPRSSKSNCRELECHQHWNRNSELYRLHGSGLVIGDADERNGAANGSGISYGRQPYCRNLYRPCDRHRCWGD